MLPLVSPVASVMSESEVPVYPFTLKIGAVFSIINCRVRSALFMTQNYTIRYNTPNLFWLSSSYEPTLLLPGRLSRRHRRLHDPRERPGRTSVRSARPRPLARPDTHRSGISVFS